MTLVGIEREPSRGGYERNHLSMFSAICFLSYEATIYDAGHHNFESPPGWAGVVSTGSSMCSFWARLELGLTQLLREVSVGWAAPSGALDAVSESATSEGWGLWIMDSCRC